MILFQIGGFHMSFSRKTQDTILWVAILLVDLSVVVWVLPRQNAHTLASWSLYYARMRMVEVKDKSNLASVVIACSNTKDPISCIAGKDGVITVTYFKGDNSHRELYMTQQMWVEQVISYSQLKQF